MSLIEKVYTHIQRIERAVADPRGHGDFFTQIFATYSTVAILDIAKFLSGTENLKGSEQELSNWFGELVPFANLAYVIRIQDFHRGGLIRPENSGKLRFYMFAHTATRPGQSHGEAAVSLGVDGSIERIRTKNAIVEMDKPLVQSDWGFKTEDMPELIDIRMMNQENHIGVLEFLYRLGMPRPADP